MFSVSGLEGSVFHGSFEELIKTHRAPSFRHPRHVREEGQETAFEHLLPAEERHYQAAASAYAAAEKTSSERGPIYYAYQVMSRHLLTQPADSSVDAAWRALAGRGVGQAPVVDRKHRLVGLVARVHLLHALNEEGGALRDVLSRTVANVMATPVVTANPVTDVRRIAQVMLQYSVPAVPIVDESEALVGIVTRGDILRVVVTDPPLTLWA
jgi:acetoin utilization protein AcuB